MQNYKKRLLAYSLTLGMILPTLPTFVSHAAGSIKISEDNFPDPAFRSEVAKQFDSDGDTFLSVEECEAVTSIGVESCSISSVDGIAFFPNLETLDCKYNNITSLDISKNPSLLSLSCDYNKLTSLDVSQNPLLQELRCGKNQLTDLDVSHNTELQVLYCYYNPIKMLDLENQTKLVDVSCANCQLTDLDVSGLSGLKELYCGSNELQKLDISHNTELEKINCSECGLTTLDVSNNTKLTWLCCEKNSLATLDVGGCVALDYLQCNNNNLVELDLSNNTILTGLYCYDNQIENLIINTHNEYNRSVHINCSGNRLKDIDLSNCSNLISLYCAQNQLTELDLSSHGGIVNFTCSDNMLTELDLSHNTQITGISCSNNNLTNLIIGNNTKVRILECQNNQLTNLDLTNNTALESIQCNNNNLEKLNLSSNSKLKSLHCESNQLEELDLSQNSALMQLYCNDNNLTELDLSNNPKLSWLICEDNPLTFMDVRNNTLYKSSFDPRTIVIKSDDDLGWNAADDKTYYIVDDGVEPKKSHPVTGVVEIDGEKHYFNSQGVLQTDIVIPSDIKVTPSSVTLTCLDTVTLTATPTPSEVAGEDLIWKSDDESIVMVSQDGVVTPVSEGSTFVTVSSIYDPAIMYMVPVTVKPVISLETSEIMVLAGGEAECKYALNTDKLLLIRLISENPEIVSITSDNLIQGEREGETDVIMQINDAYDYEVTFRIHVVVSGSESINTNIRRIELYRNGTLVTEDDDISGMPGDLLEFSAKVYVTGEEDGYECTFDQPVIQTNEGRIRLIWKSTNPSVVTINRGSVTVESAGIAFITAQAMGSTVMSDAITVSAKARPINLRSVTISGNKTIE
ncbi:MAG: Ig-like domain-containing protein [Eubacterium sp.]|nr:Ig-like domain-containing protein [Eubacterium sp.]